MNLEERQHLGTPNWCALNCVLSPICWSSNLSPSQPFPVLQFASTYCWSLAMAVITITEHFGEI